VISLAAVAAAGLLAGLSADPALAPALPPDVEVEAGSMRWEGDANRYVLEGGVVVRRGLVTLRARAATLDVDTGEVQATGGVLLTDATRAVSAEGIRALLGGSFEADGVVAFLKEGPIELGRAETVEDARRAGRNRVSFTGRRLEGDPNGRLRLQDARLTLCDCGGGAPSWEIRARRADVIAGERAILSWPVLYVTPRLLFVERPVPVLAVPWLYLPLGDRQSGLLAPVVGSTGAPGFTVSLPLFLTLGRSADATLTAEWMNGRKPTGRPEDGAVRGGGARLELRWAPAEGLEGQVELHGVLDDDREPFGAGGARLGILGRHRQRLGAATSLQVDLALASDPVWVRDFTPGVLARGATYARSDLLVSRRSDALVLELGAAYLQPLTPLGRPAGLDYGTFGAEVPVFHRWPSLSATLLPVTAGPLSLAGRLGLSRFSAASGGATSAGLAPGDPGARAGITPTPLDLREAVTRLDLRTEASAPLARGGLLLEPYARGAAAGYAFDASRASALAAWGVAGTRLSAEWSRRFGAVAHAVVPRLELRAVSGVAGERAAALPPAYDGWDRVSGPPAGASVRTLTAAPGGRLAQLRLSIENRIEGPAGHLRLELGQDHDLRRGRFAETFFSGVAVGGPVTADVAGRVLALDPRPIAAARPAHRSWLDEFTELRAGIGVANRRGDLLRASLLAVGPGASGILSAGIDPLFDLRPAPVCPSAQGTVGARAVIGGATLGYDAVIAARTIEPGECNAVGTRRVEAWDVQQHLATLVWDSPCRCFLARFAVGLEPKGKSLRSVDVGDFSYSASIDLSRLAGRARVE
jgi:LPS-assembly protein